MNAQATAVLDAWRRDQPDLPTRPEAIRRLVERALATTGSGTPPGAPPARQDTPGPQGKPRTAKTTPAKGIMSKAEQIASLRRHL